MTEISQLIEALKGLVSGLIPHTHQAEGSSKIKSIQRQSINFEAFDETNETFDLYCQRLENFFNLRGLEADDEETKNAKKMILLNCLGSKHYKFLATLTAPQLPKTKTFEEILTILKKQLTPKVNVLTEQHRFFSKIQAPTENITDYVATLKELAKDCNFKGCDDGICSKTVLELLLRAQFIRGLYDRDIRERILQYGDVNFEESFNTAISVEASKIQNREVYSSNPTINKVYEKDNYKKQSRSASSGGDRHVTFKKSNLMEYGLKGLCLCCGKSNHKADACSIKKKLKCTACGKKGHIAKVCSISTITTPIKYVTTEEDEFELNIIDIQRSTTNDKNTILQLHSIERKFFINLQIGNKKQLFEVDTGSPVTLLSENDFNQLQIQRPLTNTNVKFRSYTGNIFRPLGKVTIPVKYKGFTTNEEIYIIQEPYSPLLGRAWIRNLNINLQELSEAASKQIHSVTEMDTNVDEILKKYSDVFEPIVGQIPGYECSLKLKMNSTPIYRKPRPVPYALLTKVNHELDILEKEGIIQPVETSEWGTPLVPISKPDGGVRICADYKTTVNHQLHEARYPIPRIEDIFNKMKNGNYFCTLDVFKAYLHIKVDEESSKISAISTHRGTYAVKRLFFGLKTAPNEFHRIFDQLIQHLDGVVAYFDDIVVQGSTIQECKHRLEQCLQQLQKFNIHLNKNKCRFFTREIKYLGHVISEKGLQKANDKVEAVLKAPRPKDLDELRAFLGLVNYYIKFIPDASTKMYPLNRLLRKDVAFHWSAECEKSFKSIKQEITGERVLTPFDPAKPLLVATDANPYGLAAVLSHLIDGKERPIQYISRSLTVAERNYSQLDREATAVYWSFKRLYHYLFGREFTLIIDNKPLQSIFAPDKQLPVLSATRLLRYASFLSGFDYKIQHRSSKLHTNVDYLSRQPLQLQVNQESFENDDYRVNTELIASITKFLPVTLEKILTATNEDEELHKLQKQLQKDVNTNTDYSLHEGIIMKGQRVVIPKLLQPIVLKELHSTHIGIVKMKMIARSYCYWQGIDCDIESTVKSCVPCSLVKKNPTKVPLHTWEEP